MMESYVSVFSVCFGGPGVLVNWHGLRMGVQSSVVVTHLATPEIGGLIQYNPQPPSHLVSFKSLGQPSVVGTWASIPGAACCRG